MKKYIVPLLSIFILMAMAGCSSSDDEVAENNNAEGKLVAMTFTATQETNIGTRAALDNSNNVNWQTDDKISVFDGEGNQQFTLTGDVSEGKFSGTALSSATKFTAVYPYTSEATLGEDGSVSGITLLAEQTATLDSFDPAAALMMAVSTEENKYQLNFKNAVSLLKITTEFVCKKIVLNANEDIAGTGTLKYNSGEPSITFDSNQSKSITLKPATTGDDIAAGTYYIVVPAITLANGFSISFTASDYNVYTRTSTASNTFNRSKIKDFQTYKTTGNEWSWTHTSRGDKVTADQEVDLGITLTLNNKTYRVIFAKSNLTTTGLAANETDYGDYFAWAATEPWYTSYTGESFTGWKDGKSDGYNKDNCPSYNSNNYVENNVLKIEYDAARHILGGDWQIPTSETGTALVDKSTKTWDDTNKGYKFEKNGQTLFFPAAGDITLTTFYNIGSNTNFYYWSSTAGGPTTAYRLPFTTSSTSDNNYSRSYGFPVRPVRLVEE